MNRRTAQLFSLIAGGKPEDYMPAEIKTESEDAQERAAGQRALAAMLRAMAPKGFKAGKSA